MSKIYERNFFVRKLVSLTFFTHYSQLYPFKLVASLSVRIKDKKTHSTPVQRRLDLLAGEVEKLREQIKKKLQQLEELQRILNSQNTFRSEELP